MVLNQAGTQVVAESRHHPYGVERWRSGTFPTDYRYTGQRQEKGLGLYRMGARWYSRWLSADTLVPGAWEPQALNRYSYVLGNPLRYIDPSGHKETGECGYNGEECPNGSPPPPDLFDWLLKLLSDPAFLEWLDNWLWENVPSVIGVNAGVQFNLGFMFEGDLYPIDFSIVFNWRSGEISFMDSPGGDLYLGTPRLFGAAAYGGVVKIKGASENNNLQGWSAYYGVSASAEECAGVGVSVTDGRAITLDAARGKPVTVMGHQVGIPDPVYQYIDPGSGRSIATRQDNLTVSFNAIPNTIDVGAIAGLNYTALTTFRLPWWPLRK